MLYMKQLKKAKVALEDGRIFNGYSFGANGTRFGEVVFNTSMAGYQEILTDPSYKGQIVTMTYPLIGNYGVNLEDVESRRPFVEGFIVKECSRIASNWRSTQTLDEYLKEIKSPYKAIVAFSGTKKYKGVEYTEVGMNNFKTHKNDVPKNFKKSEKRFLIVANKYQTGFDQPLLHTMYVDKKLAGVQAVQALSRLNRANKPYKKDTFVLDFYNDTAEIKVAFDPYYTSTILSEETNPNKLNDLVDALEVFEVYSEYQMSDFFEKYINGEDRTKLDPIIDSSAHIFKNDLDKNKQIDFKVKAKSFLRTYSYLAKILDFNNQEWEKLWWYLKY